MWGFEKWEYPKMDDFQWKHRSVNGWELGVPPFVETSMLDWVNIGYPQKWMMNAHKSQNSVVAWAFKFDPYPCLDKLGTALSCKVPLPVSSHQHNERFYEKRMLWGIRDLLFMIRRSHWDEWMLSARRLYPPANQLQNGTWPFWLSVCLSNCLWGRIGQLICGGMPWWFFGITKRYRPQPVKDWKVSGSKSVYLSNRSLIFDVGYIRGMGSTYFHLTTKRWLNAWWGAQSMHALLPLVLAWILHGEDSFPVAPVSLLCSSLYPHSTCLWFPHFVG